MAGVVQGTRGTESYGKQRPGNWGTRITTAYATMAIKKGKKRKSAKCQTKVK
jgi:hypothetical protein